MTVWIETRNAKPQNGRYVLGAWINRHGLATYSLVEFSEDGFWICDEPELLLAPTYWMAIPETPKDTGAVAGASSCISTPERRAAVEKLQREAYLFLKRKFELPGEAIETTKRSSHE